MGDRDNCYILLELDPSVKDEAGIREAIKAKQAQWSKERGHPTKGGSAQQNLQKLKNIEAVLLDPKLRSEEAEAAKKILLEREREKYEELRKTAFIVVEDNKIAEQDLGRLAKQFKMPEGEIVRILKVTVKKEEAINYKDDGVKPLEASVAQKIQTNLDLVGKEDLFRFLDLPPTSSCAILLKRADEEYERNSKNANKTAEVSARLELASCCKTYLKNDDALKAYKKTLSLKAFEGIGKMLDIAAGDGVIKSNEYQKIIKACTDKGIALDHAEFYVHEYCAKKKIPPPQKPENAEYRQQVQCGFCGHLNSRTDVNCGNCSEPLRIICPKCGKEAASAQKSCSGCGFSIGDMPNAGPLVRDAALELKKKNFQSARELLAEAEIFNPKHPDAEKIRAELKKEDDAVKRTGELFARRKFCEAQAEIARLKELSPGNPAIPGYEEKAEKRIAAAGKLCREANAEPIPSKKLDLFEAALGECADFPAAVSGVSSIPVGAPSGLTAAKDNRSVFLRWNAPPDSRAVRYRIIRKENSAPAGPSDGKFLAESENTNFRDDSAEMETKYYYGVFCARGSGISPVAVLDAPVFLEMVLEDVKNLRGKISGGNLYLDWEFPARCDSVKIEYSHNKEKTAPVTAFFTRAQYGKAHGFVIKQPEGRDYYFTVCCRYASGGREYFSKGVDCLVVNSGKINIMYKVVKKGRMFSAKTACVRLECKQPVDELPEILVVAKRGGFPLKKQDGKCVMSIKGVDIMKLTRDIDIPPREVENQEIRLFFAEDNPRMELIRS